VSIIGIDPGNTLSAWLTLFDGTPTAHGKEPNHGLLQRLRDEWNPAVDLLAIEGISSYGMAVGREVFDTCIWIGRFHEAWAYRGGDSQLVYRRDVKLFHCESVKANDSNIRAALIDRYGPGKSAAIGIKAKPGPLYGIKADEWSALALALTVEGRRHVTHAPRDAFEAMEAG
jgi:hypothetical protein